MSRNEHQTKEYEELFKRAEKDGWRIEGGGNKHFKMKCPCIAKHLRVVSTTPGTRQDLLRLKTQLRRATCWKG